MFDPNIQAVIDQVDRLREQVDDHWQIPREAGRLLAQLVRIGRYRSICEIGTSYGFSALHLAAATDEFDGWVHSIDVDPRKSEAAGQYLQRAGLAGCVTLHTEDARQLLPRLEPAEPFDFVFFDAVKQQSREYLQAIRPKLAKRALLVTDNTATHPDELADFIDVLRNLPGVSSCDVPVGNGFELTLIAPR